MLSYIYLAMRRCSCLLLISVVPALAAGAKEPVDYVDPNIGGIGHLLQPTLPSVQLPYGMVRLAPITTPGITDRYLADKIYGFPVAGAALMPIVGTPKTVAAKYASEYDHDLETVSPYYASELLEKYDIRVEYTVGRLAAYYRVSFPADQAPHVLFNAGKSGDAAVRGSNAVSGSAESDGVRSYFYAEFSRPFADPERWPETSPEHGLSVGFGAPYPRSLEVRVGVSFISIEQAQRNLAADLPDWQFGKVKASARAAWSQELARIAVKGGTEKQRTIFYTALYRSMGRMMDITEAGDLYQGLDGKAHAAEGHHFYSDDGLWDTYRSLHPLQLLLDPARQVDMVRSYLRMYDQTGWLPAFPLVNSERAFMIGHHATPFIVDTYAKGYRDFDLEKAYAAMKKNAMEATMLPWKRGPLTDLDRVYLEKGFFPALRKGEAESNPVVYLPERRQAVSVTLENAYDDWALAQFAKALHKDDDYAYFMRRAANYRNLFNPAIQFMAPKSADGNWVAGFDPKLGGGQGGRDYFAEVNSWIYTFHVQHDIAGLINLMGGRAPFLERLDRLFVEQYSTSKWDFLKQFPDATGLIGQYAQGNEPSFHIPYLYNYAGQPWKTARHVRQAMQVWYSDTPLGICGDEDGGAMSSWYVFSAMGFYPVSPGRPVYDIGSPIFEEVKITLANGKTFTVTAEGASAANKYIQSARLNGRALDRPWFEHGDIANGGTLTFEMGSHPNRAWGSSPHAAPPSMSQETNIQ
jgi:predicted alpha-1,2-mannosidase